MGEAAATCGASYNLTIPLAKCVADGAAIAGSLISLGKAGIEVKDSCLAAIGNGVAAGVGASSVSSALSGAASNMLSSVTGSGGDTTALPECMMDTALFGGHAAKFGLFAKEVHDGCTGANSTECTTS